MTGTTLSHYKIVSELGRGGMGIVYRATDTKLNRDVALKVLPPSALASEDDRARFFREAQSAAQLTHAHIATVYGVDEAVPEGGSSEEPRPFIAMELIDGDSLDDVIKKGPLKVADAVRIASEVADALQAAHDRDIVHRDIKGGNIMLTAGGAAKVLDFGLAKTAQSTQLTRMGSTLGTVAYMSPEQARGEEVDHRTDLWSLGVVLYEMIAGTNPFIGDYEQAMVYSILNEDPEPLTAIRTGVPMELEMVVSKCLRKDAAHRYQTAAGLIADLKAVDARSGSMRTTTRMAVAAESAQSAKKSTIARSVAMVLVAFIAGVLMRWVFFGDGSQNGQPPSDIVRTSIELPSEFAFQGGSGYELGLELSALDLTDDGRLLVYPARHQGERFLAIRDMRTGEMQALEGTTDAFTPRFSPDGNWIAYVARNELYRIPVDGGRPRFITTVSNPTGVAWLPDDYIYLADVQGSTLMRVSQDGEVEVLNGDERCNCGLPTVGPDGIGVVVSGRDEERVQWWTPDYGIRLLDIAGQHVTFLDRERVLFANTGLLLAAAFNQDTGATGEEHIVVADLRTGSIVRSGHYALSANGTLVYVAGEPSGRADVVIRDASGNDNPIGLPSGEYGPVHISPDERYLIIRNYLRGGQLRLFDLQTGSDQPLPLEAEFANWNHDGSAIVAVRPTGQSERREVVRFDLAGSSESVLFETEERIFPEAFSPDGRYMSVRTSIGNEQGIRVHDLETGDTQTIGQTGEASFWAGDFSRDGRFFSYTRVGEGGSQVFVEPFPFDGTYRRLTPDHGEEAEMLPDEDALVYRNGGAWYKVRYGDSLDSFSDPELLFSGPYINVAGMEYRVLRNGRFLFLRSQNPDLELSRFEVISGFDRLVDEALGQ